MNVVMNRKANNVNPNPPQMIHLTEDMNPTKPIDCVVEFTKSGHINYNDIRNLEDAGFSNLDIRQVQEHLLYLHRTGKIYHNIWNCFGWNKYEQVLEFNGKYVRLLLVEELSL